MVWYLKKFVEGVGIMAKDRVIPCMYYVCKGECKKGRRDAEINGICKTCSKYKPRARVRVLNKKKEKLRKLGYK